MTNSNAPGRGHPGAKPAKRPTLVEVGDEAVRCPFCDQKILPAGMIHEQEDAYNPCDHTVLEYKWGDDWEIEDPEISTWWESIEERRSSDEDGFEYGELFRECPYLDHLFEHTSYPGPGLVWVLSIGFRAPVARPKSL